jgi:hypothetical protein
MKEKMIGLMRKGGWILITGLMFLSVLPAGCFSQPSNTSNSLKINYLDTASDVAVTNGQRDWRNYDQKKIFPSGYAGELWIMFGFSNMLHNRETKIKTEIYIYSGEEIKDRKYKEADLSDSNDNTLFWGDTIEISTYPSGNYSVILMITDLITGVRVGTKTNFIIVGTS